MTMLAHLDPAYQTGLLIALPFFAAAVISAVILAIARRHARREKLAVHAHFRARLGLGPMEDDEDLWLDEDRWADWDRQVEIARNPMG